MHMQVCVAQEGIYVIKEVPPSNSYYLLLLFFFLFFFEFKKFTVIFAHNKDINKLFLQHTWNI